MTNPAQLPQYHLLAETLGQHEPAEMHGLLCGQLCAYPNLALETWLDTAIAETDADAALIETLRQLYDATAEQLDDPQFQFELLLPSDDEPLETRVQALSSWGQGFLSGLGLGGLKTASELPSEAGEFLRDLSHITQVDFDARSEDEGDESAYSEITEYLRVGVLLVRQTFQSTPAGRLH